MRKVAKKRKGKRGDASDEPKLAPVPDKLARPFAEALAGLKLDPPPKPGKVDKGSDPLSRPKVDKGSDPLSRGSRGVDKGSDALSRTRVPKAEDAIALRRAFAGVKPLADRAGRLPPSHPDSSPPPREAPELRFQDTSEDDAARARLASLVGGGMRFDVRRGEDGRVEAIRTGGDPGPVLRIVRGRLAPEATLDLHGMTAAEAEQAIVRFVREQHRRGVRAVCLVHGKGLHSEGGIPVLADRAVRALTEGGAAPLVLAFATAPRAHGGTGALLVQLVDRL